MGFEALLRILPASQEGPLELCADASFQACAEYHGAFERTFAFGMPAGSGMGSNNQGSQSTSMKVTTAPVGWFYPTLPHLLLARADPYSRTYSKERRDDLADALRTRMLAFLTDIIHVSALGRRIAHDATWWFSQPRVWADRAGPEHWKALRVVLSHFGMTEDDAIIGPRNQWQARTSAKV